MNRPEFSKTSRSGAVVLLSALAVLPLNEAAAQKPNVILVMTDDHGYGDLGCTGNPFVKTPNIDKLHAQSVRLTDFHVSPTCSPTRAALMTGRYCNRTGVWHTIMGRSLLRKDEVTMADVFRANGYRTGIFGKWHLGDNYPFRPQDRGFHDVLVHRGGGVGQGLDYWDNDYFDDTYYHNGKPEKFEGYCTDIWFAEAMEFIEKNRNQPFFCYIPTNAAHGPFFVAEKYSRPYKEKGLKSPLAEFYGMVTNIDENMGKLLQRLDALRLADNTILIFMTDNGGEPARDRKRFNAGMRGFKGSMYDGGHRVPFFIRWPGGGLEGGRDVKRLAAHIDILPTLIDLCRLKGPQVQDVRLDGKNLKPLLTGESSNWPERVVITDSQRVDHPIKWRRSATMTNGWRLINGEELYDIKADPSQSTDVATEHPDVVRKLRKAYEEWWADTSVRFGEYCEIIIGAPEQNPTCLMAHDIHGKVVWNQGMVRRGERSDGFWAAEVARDGTYEFALRRWPREVNRPISEKASPDQQRRDFRNIVATDARLKIADVDETRPIPSGAAEVSFRIKLKAGKTRCQGWFINGLDDGETHGAYYVYVRRLD